MRTVGRHLIKDGWVVIFTIRLGFYLASAKYVGG
ncbi:MAG: hypothetical protein A4E73_01321 [Syntrophaceae bacterium PtaU1.Bin231]|nr:MAG: hypothetical protein A4E73_01321 [Syntrophaceae bacterium PtaU1.Bin231]